MSMPTVDSQYSELVEKHPGIEILQENLLTLLAGNEAFKGWLNPNEERTLEAYPDIGILLLKNYLCIDAVSLLKRPKLKTVETSTGHHVARIPKSVENTRAAATFLASSEELFGEPNMRIFYNRYDEGCSGSAHADGGALHAMAFFAAGNGRLRVDTSENPASNVDLDDKINALIFAKLEQQGKIFDLHNTSNDVVIAGDLARRLHNGGSLGPQKDFCDRRETIGLSAIAA
jgi:hypothetical protein